MQVLLDQTHLERAMVQALRQAEMALDLGEVPIGAVVIKDQRIIGRGYNQREALRDPTAHAEIIAITAAANSLQDWRLNGCELYVTKEPCPMCAGAIMNARIDFLGFGAYDEEAGCAGSLYQLVREPRFNHESSLRGGILEAECSALLQEFFRRRREKG